VTYKLCLLTYKCLQAWAPAYLARLYMPIESVAGRPRVFFVLSCVMEQSTTCTVLPICVPAVFQTFSENILVSCLVSVFRRRHRRLCDVMFVNCSSLKYQFIIIIIIIIIIREGSVQFSITLSASGACLCYECCTVFSGVIVDAAFPTPMDEPRKVMSCHFLGTLAVSAATGIVFVFLSCHRLILCFLSIVHNCFLPNLL